jgi:hypothetical protein
MKPLISEELASRENASNCTNRAAQPSGSDKNKIYWQSVSVKGNSYHRAIAWQGAPNLIVIHVPISEANSSSIISVGKFFEPLITDGTVCYCFAECPFPQEGTDLSSLVEFLRSGR